MQQILTTVMTVTEARACVAVIRAHLTDARAALLDLYEREGWKALGYPSWRQCVVTEFGQHQSYLYRLLNAGLIEREVSPLGEIGTIPETHLRELGALDDAALRKAAWDAAEQEAQERGEKVTARLVKQAVAAAAEWANEYITTQGYTSLGGESLDIAQAAITERMAETRQRQTQHIADSYTQQLGEKLVADGVVAEVGVDDAAGYVMFHAPGLVGLTPGQAVKLVIYVKTPA
jgi:hypothetical protein